WLLGIFAIVTWSFQNRVIVTARIVSAGISLFIEITTVIFRCSCQLLIHLIQLRQLVIRNGCIEFFQLILHIALFITVLVWCIGVFFIVSRIVVFALRGGGIIRLRMAVFLLACFQIELKSIFRFFIAEIFFMRLSRLVCTTYSIPCTSGPSCIA